MDRVDKAKIESLLSELQMRSADDPVPSVAALARRYRLDPMIVKRVAQSQGIELEPEPARPPGANTSATDFIRVEDVEEFARKRGK